MNAGQMMMQTPVNATMTVPVPASPAMVTLPAGDQQANDFADVLAGMTPQASSQPGEAAGTATPVDGGAPAAKEIALVPMLLDAEVAIVAALQATTAKAVQAEPAEAGVSEDQAEPVEVNETRDAEMPQNVVLCASGALVAAEQQIIGRMPEQDLGVADRGGVQDKARLVGEVDQLKSQPPAAVAEALLKSAEAPLSGGMAAVAESETAISPKVVHQMGAVEARAKAPAEAVLATTTARTEQAGTLATPVRRSVAAGQPLPSVELPEQAAAKQEMNSAVKANVAQSYESAAMAASVPLNQQQAAVSPEQTHDGSRVKATAQAETAVKGAAVEQRQAANAQVHGSVSGEQAQAVIVEQAVRIEVPEARADFQGSAVQQRVASKKEAIAVLPLQGGDAGLLNPETDESAALAAKPLKEQATVHPAEFRFSRSAAVEAALGGSQPDSVRTPEKNLPGQTSSMKIAVEQPLAVETDGGFSGSDAGSTAGEFEGFVQQAALTEPPAMQDTPGVVQTFSVDGKITTSTQVLQTEPSRPVSSEHIAGQVREQLGTHEIKSGSEQITIRLSPDHLGDIKVNFRLEDQHLKVEIVTENRLAKESLLQHADSLKESLARQNISMDKFDVTTSSNNSGNQGNNAQGEWRELAKNRQTQQWLASGGYRSPSAGEVQKPPVYLARADHAVLDLHF